MALIHNLVARFRADTATFDRKVKKSRTGMTRFGKDVKLMGRQMLAIAGVGGGLYALTRGLKSAVKAASAAQETQAKFNTVLKEFSKEGNLYAENFGRRVGRSIKDVKAWVAGLQDTFVPLGFARDEAYKLSKSLVELGVDIASFNEKADADVINNLTSAIVGNHRAVRSYGIVITESRLKQEAMLEGLNKTYNELTEIEKAQLRYNIIIKNSADAQGDAMRTADSYANQIKRLKGALDDLKVTLGNEVIPALTEVIQFLNKNRMVINRYISDFKEGLQIAKEFAEWAQNLKYFFDPFYKAPATVPAQKSIIKSMIPTIEESAAMREFQKAWAAMVGEMEKADAIETKYQGLIQKEIDLTGRVGEAHWHAAKMVEFENEMKKAGVIDTNLLADAYEAMRNKLKELEKAQRLAKIAEDIGDSFADAFEDMIFEAKKFSDVFKAVMKDIARSVMRNLVTQPIGLGISGMIGGMFGMTPAKVGHSGGIVGSIGRSRNVPAMAFAGAPRLHSGLMTDEFPTILQRGEQVIPKGGGYAPTIIINNQSGQPMRQERESFFDGRNWVVKIVADNIQNGGILRKMVQS